MTIAVSFVTVGQQNQKRLDRIGDGARVGSGFHSQKGGIEELCGLSVFKIAGSGGGTLEMRVDGGYITHVGSNTYARGVNQLDALHFLSQHPGCTVTVVS